MQSSEFPKTTFDLIAGNGRMLEFWNNETNTGTRPGFFRVRVRGSCGPDLEVHGPDALPLPCDAL